MAVRLVGVAAAGRWIQTVRSACSHVPTVLRVNSLRSPVAWTRSSVIYTAHPSQPVVLGRHFPSSRQFVVPTPSLFIDNTASYDPPTVISISPAEDWLFAYFPGRGCDGVGYLWKRASQLDCWFVQEKLNYAPGAGVVTAEWTSTERPVSVPILMPKGHNLNVASVGCGGAWTSVPAAISRSSYPNARSDIAPRHSDT